MTDLTQIQVDAIFQIIATKLEEKGPVEFTKPDIKDKMIKQIDKQVSKTITDVRKALLKAIDDKLDDADVGFILKEIINIKIKEDIALGV